MHGIYADVIAALDAALEKFDKTEDLLSYPEVQADRAVYVATLGEYNRLLKLKELGAGLKSALAGERECIALLGECKSESDARELYGEVAVYRIAAARRADEIAAELGLGRTSERACCRMRFSDSVVADIGLKFAELIKRYFTLRGGYVTEERESLSRDGDLKAIEFTVEGRGAVGAVSLFSGVHRVTAARDGEIALGVTYAPVEQEISEGDIKTEFFRSDGAGGQNVNKVETAVRVTHLPTGTTVTCRDERSQLANRKRAMQTLRERLNKSAAESEKKRIEAELSAQCEITAAQPTFNARAKTMTDVRVTAFKDVAFPLSDEDFAAYMNALLSI